MSITHGVVSIEDGKKADTEYTPARKVRVELHFDVPEGQDADTAIAQVSALADSHVKRLLGQPLAENSGAISSQAAEKPARQAGPRGKPKPIEVILPPETKPDPAAVEEVVDDFSAPAVQETKPITDAELHSAAQKKNSEIKNPLAIRTLVSSFRPEGSTVGFQLTQVPQDRRREFLDKLAKLT